MFCANVSQRKEKFATTIAAPKLYAVRSGKIAVRYLVALRWL
jgi:hypothetical protein